MTASSLPLDPIRRPDVASRLRLAILIVGLWTILGLAATQVQVLSFAQAGLPVVVGRFLRWNLWSVWLWAAFTPGIVLLARRWPVDRYTWRRAVPIHVGGVLVFAALDALGNHLVAPWLFPFRRLPTLSEHFLQQLLVNQGSYMIVAALAHAHRYAALYRDRRTAADRLEAQLTAARLTMLQAQLHPHFLFNTLNAIAEQVHADPHAADAMILRLGTLLRATLRAPDRPEVSLREELALTQAYLELMRLRLGERLRVRVAVPPELLDARVPALLLQPLVENALRHGIERRVAAGTIEVAGRAEGGRLILEVLDDGAGVGADPAEGVGLRNTRARLRHLHGDAATLTLADRRDGGAAARLTLPLVRDGV
jgi:sensor histidine kinase YesM